MARDDRPTGSDLADAIERAAQARGVPLAEFIRPMFNDVGKLDQMRMSTRPTQGTIERVRALIRGEPVPPPQRTPPPVMPQQFVRRVEREAAGLPPSGRELSEQKQLVARERERRKVAHLRDVAETRQQAHDRRLREVVEREAAERTRRRREARRLTTAHPLAADEVEEDVMLDDIDTAGDRRAREVAELASPSSVLRRAQRDWPDQCAKVKALADELGVQLGEAWRRVIAAGVDAMTDPEAA